MRFLQVESRDSGASESGEDDPEGEPESVDLDWSDRTDMIMSRTTGMTSTRNQVVQRILQQVVPQTEALSGFRECAICGEG